MTIPMSGTNDNEQPRLFSKKQAATYCGVTHPTFAKWVIAGVMPPPVSITRKWDRKAIDAVLDKLSGLEDSRAPESSLDEWRREYDAKKYARQQGTYSDRTSYSRAPDDHGHNRVWSQQDWQNHLRGRELGLREIRVLECLHACKGESVTVKELKGAGQSTMDRIRARGYIVTKVERGVAYYSITPEGEAAWLACNVES